MAKPLDFIQIKLLIENKLIICALGNLHYKISRERARNPEVRGSNPGSDSNVSLEILYLILLYYLTLHF